MTFLETITHMFLERYGKDLDKLAFVFPTRRARLYFQQHLQKYKPEDVNLWSPTLYSIEDFFVYLSKLTVLEPLDLIFELYRVYHHRVRHYKHDFEDFYPWGKMIISDFNEMDKHLVDIDKLFTILKEFKGVDDIARDEQSTIYKRYTGFWEDLGLLYRDFGDLLRRDSKAYEGMAFRTVAENIELITHQPDSLIKWDKVIFCGFNVLSTAEQNIIRYLIDINRAEIYWDMDHYFVDDVNQEAGDFFRKYRATFPNEYLNWVGNRMFETKFIDIIGVQSKVSQAKVLGLKLKELMQSSPNPENIAIVLPDESLLFPTLNSIPESVEQINVTLGFPLEQTPVYSLFDTITEMQSRAAESPGFYYKDVQRVLNHPYIKPFAPDLIPEVMNIITKKNLIYIGEVNDIKDKDGAAVLSFGLFKKMFRRYSDSTEIMDFFIELLGDIRDYYRENKPDLFFVNYEYIYHFYTLMTRLKNSLTYTGVKLTIQTFRQLFGDIVKNNRIPFTGEPLKGLQIMGVLETQTLDFDHLYIMSVNEGHLPVGKSHQSFIPFEVRSMMGLPTYKERDAMAAYHFYRLVKNSRHITLLYVTESRGMEKSEKSRFIDQILIEYVERNKNAKINHSVIDFSFETGGVKEISIQKSPAIIEALSKLNYSSSSLLSYLTCPLKFYFTQIMDLTEEAEVTESPDYIQIGHIIHDALKNLYTPYLKSGKPVNSEDLDRIKMLVDQQLISSFKLITETDDISSGRNRIVYEVMRKYLENFFEKERKRAGFKVIMLEKKIENIHFEFPINGQTHEVLLKGTIDRLDLNPDGNYCLIDYKTGAVGSLNFRTDDLREELAGQNAVKQKEAFQLLFYRFLIKKQGKYNGSFQLSIYPFKKLYDELSFLKINKSDIIDESVTESIEELLTGIFQELFNVDIPFTQTKVLSNCHTCRFIDICGKDGPAR